MVLPLGRSGQKEHMRRNARALTVRMLLERRALAGSRSPPLRGRCPAGQRGVIQTQTHHALPSSGKTFDGFNIQSASKAERTAIC
jgi:hypothetical protein